MNYVRDSWCGICTKRLDTKKKSYLKKISLNSIYFQISILSKKTTLFVVNVEMSFTELKKHFKM